MTTRELADFTSALTFDKLLPRSREMAKRCILDWLSLAIRGSREKPAAILRQVMDRGAADEATIFAAPPERASVYGAAMANAAASHSLDFDDLHNPSIIHLACVVVPGVIAMAEKERASGRDILTAVCAGYEAGARVGEAVIPESYFFWHTTGTAGTFGAAAAAANLLRLDPRQTLMCYGTAGTQAAGLWEFLKEGAMSKSLHAGKSAYAGVLSAYLSRAGFTGAGHILEGKKGFCRAMVEEPHLEKLTEGLHSGKLKIDDNSFKPYACCKHSHSALNALQELRRENDLHPEDIEAVTLLVNSITDSLINNPGPENPYGAKFSLQYCAATMLVNGVAGVEQFTAESLEDTATRQLMERISVTPSPELEQLYRENPERLASRVVIRLKDGRILEKQIDYPKGDPQNPFTWQEAEEKFMHLAAPLYGEETSGNLVRLVERLDRCDNFPVALAEILGQPGTV